MQRALASNSGPREKTSADVDSSATSGYDWQAAEGEVAGIVAPAFVPAAASVVPPTASDTELPTLTLDDVGGMDHVKERLTASFLAPLRNPELGRLYGKRLRGGLLLYGPPGCGKTYLARALAGELGASFLSIQLADVLDPYLSQSELNLHQQFQTARQNAPCVVFLDEVDGLGQRRAGMGSTPMRGVVAQLLEELDGVASGDGNEGVYVLAATNQPWDVDPALRRPGRLDRTVLVLPPDRLAREAIFRTHLRERPIEGIDVAALARRTDGYANARCLISARGGGCTARPLEPTPVNQSVGTQQSAHRQRADGLRATQRFRTRARGGAV
ncbi:ATP-binding protein [Microbacterium lacticum]|nr:ATP-binding protein [Microbacterium lacticum]